MSDIDRLDEALATAIPGFDDDGYTQPHEPSLEIVFQAARAYRDLLANGRVVDNTVMAWPGEEGLGAGKYLVVEIDPTEEVTGE